MDLQKYAVQILVVVAVVTSGSAYYFYSEYSALKQNPNKLVQEETNKLVTQIGKLIVLPEGETPTVATVSDVEKLRSQPFFAKAKKGDRVLIYANARKALLYDPESNRIVEVAPINIGQPTGQSTPPAPEEVSEEE
jgi:UDP-N-acetylglucosamine transferase subunit ALG13